MELLVGREVAVPRAMFASDIARGESFEPPHGLDAWKATIAEYEDCPRMPFTLWLDVLDEDRNIQIEEQPASLTQVRKWMVEASILPHEKRSTLGQVIVPAATKTPKTLCKAKTHRGKETFATPSDSQRSVAPFPHGNQL